MPRWFVLPYFAAFRYNIGNNSKTWSGRKLKFGMLVESVLCIFQKTKRMKSRLWFSSNCHLKKCNFFVLPLLSIECQIHKLLFLAKRMIPRSSKSDNQKQSYSNFKSSAFGIWPIRSWSEDLVRHSFIGLSMRIFPGLQNENEMCDSCRIWDETSLGHDLEI